MNKFVDILDSDEERIINEDLTSNNMELNDTSKQQWEFGGDEVVENMDNFVQIQAPKKATASTSRRQICKCDKKMKEFRDSMESRLNIIQAQMKMLLKAQSEQNLLLRNLLAIDETANEANSEFPIKTESDLQDFEKRINPETRSSYVKIIRSLFTPQGVRKNLKYVLSADIINQYNIDGVHGKKSLKELKSVYDVIIDAITVNDSSGSAEQQLREAVRLEKKRYFKSKSDHKKKLALE
ncbi:hypothetical protein DOY81_002583 [Sarcophaga bullata]|nr:hypothetical protein DOY81_002583 [Sarcophaga bullata]